MTGMFLPAQYHDTPAMLMHGRVIYGRRYRYRCPARLACLGTWRIEFLRGLRFLYEVRRDRAGLPATIIFARYG